MSEHRAEISIGERKFLLDLRSQELLRSDRESVRLTPKQWELLCYLAKNPGRLVSKEELHKAIWAGAAIGDEAISQAVRDLRKAVGFATSDSFIQTAHGRGYRFVGAVRWIQSPYEPVQGLPTVAPQSDETPPPANDTTRGSTQPADAMRASHRIGTSGFGEARLQGLLALREVIGGTQEENGPFSDVEALRNDPSPQRLQELAVASIGRAIDCMKLYRKVNYVFPRDKRIDLDRMVERLDADIDNIRLDEGIRRDLILQCVQFISTLCGAVDDGIRVVSDNQMARGHHVEERLNELLNLRDDIAAKREADPALSELSKNGAAGSPEHFELLAKASVALGMEYLERYRRNGHLLPSEKRQPIDEAAGELDRMIHSLSAKGDAFPLVKLFAEFQMLVDDALSAEIGRLSDHLMRADRQLNAASAQNLDDNDTPASFVDGHEEGSPDPDAFSRAVAEGLLMKLRGNVMIPADLLRKVARQCRGPKLIAEITNPHQDLNNDESLVAKLFSYLLVPNLRTRTWGSDEINRVVHEAGRNIRDVLLEKARILGIFRKTDGRYLVDADVLDSLLDAVVHRISDGAASEVCRCFFESWRDIIRTAVESTPGEDKNYINLLSLFMYSASYDNGSVMHCVKLCAEP